MRKLYARIVPKRLFGVVRVTLGSYSSRFQTKTVSPAQKEQAVAPDPGYDALTLVTVKAATLQEKTVTPSSVEQTVVPDTGVYGLAKVVVKAQGNHGLLQDKTVAPSIGRQVVTPDSGYYGLNSVTVKAVIKVDSVEVSPETNTFTVNFEDDTVASGIVDFDNNGLPTALTDGRNTIEFSHGWPTKLTNANGHTVTISGG